MSEDLTKAIVATVATVVMFVAIGLSMSWAKMDGAVAATNLAVLALFIRQLAVERK